LYKLDTWQRERATEKYGAEGAARSNETGHGVCSFLRVLLDHFARLVARYNNTIGQVRQSTAKPVAGALPILSLAGAAGI
jgi:hypothetical protein